MSRLNPDARVFVPIDTTKECSICAEVLQEDYTNNILLKCKHEYHKKCLKPWLDIAQTCPTCRANAVIIDRLVEMARKKAEAEAAAREKEWAEHIAQVEAAEAAKRLYHIEQHSGEEMAIVLTPLISPNIKSLQYPLSFISRDGENDSYHDPYYVKDFCKGLLEEEPFEIGDFPNNIVEYYWIHEGKNDEEAWQLFCKIKLPAEVNGNNEAYAYYTASCDYTGFDCQGGMQMSVSMSAKNLFYDIPNRTRELFLAEKRAGKKMKRVNKLFLKKKPLSIPVVPLQNIVNPTRAFIRVWHNGEELILNLDYINGVEMEELEYSIRGLTAQKIGTTNKFYNVKIYNNTSVMDIDEHFKGRFNNPNKKWLLKIRERESSYVRKWGKVEVSFTLY